MYTLKDDRVVEHGFVERWLPEGDGQLLDLGSPQGYPTPLLAQRRGWSVLAVDLNAQNATADKLEYRRGDFLVMRFEKRFDFVLNVSSVEHFGLAGRYGVVEGDIDADLKAMRKLRGLMNEGAWQIFTVPVGIDTVIRPLHRVYGSERLPLLLDGYSVTKEQYWGKRNDVDTYVPIERAEALETIVRCADVKSERADDHYYAIGCFVLEVE
jgi:SAM-dependent methyltransferase